MFGDQLQQKAGVVQKAGFAQNAPTPKGANSGMDLAAINKKLDQILALLQQDSQMDLMEGGGQNAQGNQ